MQERVYDNVTAFMVATFSVGTGIFVFALIWYINLT